MNQSLSQRTTVEQIQIITLRVLLDLSDLIRTREGEGNIVSEVVIMHLRTINDLKRMFESGQLEDDDEDALEYLNKVGEIYLNREYEDNPMMVRNYSSVA